MALQIKFNDISLTDFPFCEQNFLNSLHNVVLDDESITALYHSNKCYNLRKQYRLMSRFVYKHKYKLAR